MAKRLTVLILVIAVFASGLYLGVRNWRRFSREEPQAGSPSDVSKIESIVAQGRLLPINGIVNIPAPPGQRIDSILVGIGDLVTGGTTELALMAGRDLLQLQVEMAAARHADASLEVEQQIVAAEIQLRTAQAAQETARLQLEQLNSRTDRVIAEKQIAIAREKLERMRRLATEPLTKNLVSQQDIDDQALLLEKSESDLQRADLTLDQSQQTAELAARNAQLNVDSAQRSLDIARKMASGNQSLQLAETIAQKQLESSRIVAPSDGTVLKIFAKPGEVAVNTPLLQIGDLSRMECVAEVNDRLVRRVQIGQRALIKSAALGRDLSGTVRSISRVVGSSTLANPSPLAMVDTKTVDVHIEIDPADVAEASNFVHLQASVEIDPKTMPGKADSSVAQSVDLR